MPALFQLPKQVPVSSLGVPLAGALLHFYQTGTTTRQNTYTDVGLTVAHANPVVADANGVFGPIYLDPTLPNYRVRLETSASVLVYQVDEVPSNQNTAQSLRLESTAPTITFDETDASSGNQKWRMQVNAETLSISLLNDAESVAADIFNITRQGSTLGAVTLECSQFNINSLRISEVGVGSENQIGSTTNAVELFSSGDDVTISAGAGGTVALEGMLCCRSTISPSQITANQNDYSPTGLSTANRLRLSSDASRNITGITGGQDGRELRIFNVGAQDIVLTNEDAASTAANRFLFGANITLGANEGIVISYDATSSRWRSCGKHV